MTTEPFECKKCKIPKALSEFDTYTTRTGKISHRSTCRQCHSAYCRERYVPRTRRTGPRGNYRQSYADVKADPDFQRWLAVPPLEERKVQHEFTTLLSNRYRLDYRGLWHWMNRKWTQHWTRIKGCAPYADLLPEDEMEMSA